MIRERIGPLSPAAKAISVGRRCDGVLRLAVTAGACRVVDGRVILRHPWSRRRTHCRSGSDTKPCSQCIGRGVLRRLVWPDAGSARRPPASRYCCRRKRRGRTLATRAVDGAGAALRESSRWSNACSSWPSVHHISLRMAGASIHLAALCTDERPGTSFGASNVRKSGIRVRSNPELVVRRPAWCG